MHFVRRSSDYTLTPPPLYAGHSPGLLTAPLVDHQSGSVHTGLSLVALEPEGVLLPHVHAYEEGFYLLEGSVDVQIEESVWRLSAGDYGVIKVGTRHAWANRGPSPARWLEMAAPQPKAIGRE